MTKIKKEKFPNGDIYEGEMKNGVPHGKGKMIYPDGSKYEGDFISFEFHCNGTMTNADGSKDEGAWFEGKFLGKPYFDE